MWSVKKPTSLITVNCEQLSCSKAFTTVSVKPRPHWLLTIGYSQNGDYSRQCGRGFRMQQLASESVCIISRSAPHVQNVRGKVRELNELYNAEGLSLVVALCLLLLVKH